MRIEGIGLTDQGLKRSRNEDFIHVDNDRKLYIVCDGVGGAGNGQIASKMAAESCARFIEQGESAFNDFYRTGKIRHLESLIRDAMQHACSEVFYAAHKNSKYHGMASTMTAVLFVNDQAILGHVGDSRLYLVRNNQVYVVTEDHTLGREVRERNEMTEEDIKKNKLDHILNRSIGYFKSVEIDTLVFDILPGDELVLCSDGLHNYLRTPVQLIPMLENDESNTSLSELMQFAINGGGSDNISVVLIQTKLEESIYMGFDSGRTELLNDFSILHKIYLFHDLTFIRINRILNVCETNDYSVGETVYAKGDKVNGIYIVYDGELEAKDSSGKRITFKKGDFFAQNSLMMDYIAPYTVTAAKDSSLLFIDSADYQKLCR
ncbi:MAG: protein phosphatase 2C domain-containing protein, partial [Lentisphaeraceae bacterium]|nr:protein phosphatase 2C domain-containing protein [Lentisphaeraceae bacterium]